MDKLKITAIHLPPAQLENGEALSVKLLNEWIDIENTGNEPIRFSTISVQELLKFSETSDAESPKRFFWSGAGEKQLLPRQILRIHTGDWRDEVAMLRTDKIGADWHADAGFDDFFLNDSGVAGLLLSWQNASGETLTDHVYYIARPRHGGFLRRRGNRLEAASVRGAGTRAIKL